MSKIFNLNIYCITHANDYISALNIVSFLFYKIIYLIKSEEFKNFIILTIFLVKNEVTLKEYLFKPLFCQTTQIL